MHQPSHEQEDLYENYWNRIEKAVEYRTDWFIRFYLVSKTGKTPRQDGVYEAFRDYQKNAKASTRYMAVGDARLRRVQPRARLRQHWYRLCGESDSVASTWSRSTT